MFGKISTAAITVFWLVMMTLLVQDQLLPGYEQARLEKKTPGYSRLLELAKSSYGAQMGIYITTLIGEKRIGYSRAELRYMPADEVVDARDETQIKIQGPFGLLIPGAGMQGLDLKMKFHARVAEDGMRDVRFEVFSADSSVPLAIIDGIPIGDMLQLKIHYNEKTQVKQVPFNSRSILENDMGPMVMPGKIRVGDKWPVRSFDPSTYTVKNAWATVQREEKTKVGDKEMKLFLITVPYGAAEIKVWADADGEVYKQKVLSFTFVREEMTPSEEAEQAK